MARKSFLRVAGVIENMSAFTCDHGESYALFGSGGGQTLADDAGIPLLGPIPLEPRVSAGGDAGERPRRSVPLPERVLPPAQRVQPRRPRQAIAPQKFLNTLSDLYTGQFEIQGKFGWLTDNLHIGSERPTPQRRLNQ
jgi:hypothetical protein